MDFDLDNVLNHPAGTKGSKLPRASQRGGRPSKALKKTEVTPPPSAVQDTIQVADPTPEVMVFTQVELAAPADLLLPISSPKRPAPAPRKPASTQERLLSISTHLPEYVIDPAVGSHGINLGSNVLSRFGQSLNNLGAPQWQFLTSCRDTNTIFDKGSELFTSAFAAFVQQKFKLNIEVLASQAHAHEAKNLQLKVIDEVKVAMLKVSEFQKKLEVALASSQRVSNLKSTMVVTLKEVEAKNSEIKEKESKIRELQELNAKLEEDKNATFDIIKGEKAHLLEEIKKKKDHVVDMAMYHIWVNNPDLDTSFLDNLEAKFVERWQTRLDEEDARAEVEETARASGAAEEEEPAP
ncbi:uncharacterized protein LOC133782862 isoform X2 [Humulus lupulus]|uniref:uncharacterized protein LOC133782862 isoform X2 n=1 Tax=Humulus lupulus TaxID=3486 RepID=UPI002B40C3DB|nr:uncharacterized protein LOC133782862 isoform X2 [Humulus lupulus]